MIPASLLDAVRSALPGRVDAAVVLGSGLGDFAAGVELTASLDLTTMPGYPAVTVKGHAGRIDRCCIGGKNVLLFEGRLHGYEGHAVDVAAWPVTIAAAMGARMLVVTNAAGGIDPRLRAGDLMLITDYLVLPLAPGMGLPLQRLGGSGRVRALAPEHRALVQRAAADAGVRLEEGSYGFCSGPTYETRAEISFLRSTGIAAVGMSTVPEYIAAAAAGLPVIGISCITNQARTVPTRVTHDEVTRVAAAVSERLSRLLHALLPAFP